MRFCLTSKSKLYFSHCLHGWCCWSSVEDGLGRIWALAIILNIFACLLNPSVCNHPHHYPSLHLHLPAPALTPNSESQTTPYDTILSALTAHVRMPYKYTPYLSCSGSKTVTEPSPCKDALPSDSGSDCTQFTYCVDSFLPYGLWEPCKAAFLIGHPLTSHSV